MEGYFDWLISKVSDKEHRYYTLLLKQMYETEFFWLHPMDENLYVHGMNLRDRYAEEETVLESEYIIFQNKGCSVLEMLVALCDRCVNNILGDYSSMPSLFWSWVQNLGLLEFDDYKIWRDCEPYVDEILMNWLNRDYDEDGYGSPFYIPGTDRNMVEAEMWYQAMWYISESV